MRFVKKTKYPDGIYQEAVIRETIVLESAGELVAALANFSIPNCRAFGSKDNGAYKLIIERKVFRFLDRSYDSTTVFYVPTADKEFTITIANNENQTEVIEALYRKAEIQFNKDVWGLKETLE